MSDIAGDKKKIWNLFREGMRHSEQLFPKAEPKKEQLVERSLRPSNKMPNIKDLMPTIKITEAWGKLGNADRATIEKFTAALGGSGTTVDQKLKNIDAIINGNKEKYGISDILTVMMVVETLTAILQEFTEAAGGFIFEGFLAGLFGGQSVQIESPEDLVSLKEAEEAEDPDSQEGKPITDVYLDTPEGKKHYSLKLLGPNTAVKGSFTNMIKHFQSYDHVIYLDARIDKGTRSTMHFSEFEITLDRFLDVFYMPFQKFVSTMAQAKNFAATKKQIDSLKSKYEVTSVKFSARPPSANDLMLFGITPPDGYVNNKRNYTLEESEIIRSVLDTIDKLPAPNKINFKKFSYAKPTGTDIQKERAKKALEGLKAKAQRMFPAAIYYSEESIEKNPKAKKLFGTAANLTRVRQDLAQYKAGKKSKDDVISWLLSLPGAAGKEQFQFTPDQVRKIGTYREIGPSGGLVVGQDTLKKIWNQYADLLQTTIEPIYTNLNEFTRNINSYFLTVGGEADKVASASRLSHGQAAIGDAKELHAASKNVVQGMESQEQRDSKLEKAGEVIQDLYR